jgi:hypothetical protein
MQAELITVTEYCFHHHTEPSFIAALEENGLITLTVVEQERYITYDQLRDLENYTRWYYELDINIGGIDAMHHMLERLLAAQAEIGRLQEKLKLYEGET